MDLLINKIFIAEIFIVFAIIYFITFNVYLLNIRTQRLIILDREILAQILFIFFILSYIYYNLKIEGCLNGLLLISNNEIVNLKLLFIIFCIFSFFVIWRNFVFQKIRFFEFFIFYLSAILALLLLLNTFDLLACYVVLELQSLCFALIASLHRRSILSNEAGMRYFISSSIMSSIFLLGCSGIYACLGTLNINNIFLLLSINSNPQSIYLNLYLSISLFLVTSVILFKLVLAPFYFWFPSIYESAPLSSTIIFMLIPKIVFLFFLIRWISLVLVFWPGFDLLFLGVGLLSLFLGVGISLFQKKIKKLYIYSSIGQLGIICCSLFLDNIDALVYAFFFIIIYLITSLILWNIYTILNYSYNLSQISFNFYKLSYRPLFLTHLSGIFSFHKVWAFFSCITFFSLSGLPLFGGFLAKMFVYYFFLVGNYIWLICFLMILSCFSTFYYLRVLKILLIEERTRTSFSLFTYSLFEFDALIFSFLTSLILLSFFFPSLIILYSYQIILSIL
tara:strand:+ start:9518 stop:11035 length:1518 start_codon:yes stop_codon:yes gene_type:complete